MSWKTTRVMLISLLMTALLVSCADVPSSGPTPPEFKSEFRFVNAATDLSSGDVAVENHDGAIQTVGTFQGRGSLLGYRQFDAGSRTVTIGSETIQVAMETDWRGTVVITDQVTIGGETARTFFKVNEMRIFDSPETAMAVTEQDTAGNDITTMVPAPKVQVINAVPGATFDVVFANGETEFSMSSVASNSTSAYVFGELGSFTGTIINHDTEEELATFDAGNLAAQRYTLFLHGESADSFNHRFVTD